MTRVRSVIPGSMAAKAGVLSGDRLVSIDGEPVRDAFDYRYLIEVGRDNGGGAITMLFERAGDGAFEARFIIDDGASCETLLAEDDIDCLYADANFADDDQFGMSFDGGELMDRKRACKNRCVFCFIDQLPRGMRRTLYFKDDDLRLCFLWGNYVTLTNLSDGDIERVVKYRMSPVNVSVHATDPELRARILRPRKGASSVDIMPALRFLASHKIEINAQIVLCRGVNDGRALDRTLTDLWELRPSLTSVSVVPVGLTCHRDGLTALASYDEASARALLRNLNVRRKEYERELGVGFVYAADEFYRVASRRLPGPKYYDGYPQLENGVGMSALFIEEFNRAFRRARRAVRRLSESARDSCENTGAADGPSFASEDAPCDKFQNAITYVLTGSAAFPMMWRCAKKLSSLGVGEVIAVEVLNRYFGESITVAGLLTGKDLLEAIKKLELRENDRVLLPKTMLKHDSDLFLDGISLKNLRDELNADIIAVEISGEAFVSAATRLIPYGVSY